MKILGFEITRAKPGVASGGGRQYQPPPAWMTSYLGPGQPIQPITPSKEVEVPRTIDYPISVNAQLTPRTGYGLMPFSQLMTAYEKVPECRFPVNLIHRQLAAYQPRLIDKKGNAIPDHPYKWLCEYPDGRTPFSVWMTRYLKSAKIYDAPALYLERERGSVTGLHFIDGSTLFVILDEYGNTPMPEKVQDYVDRHAASPVREITVPAITGSATGPRSVDALITQYNQRLSEGREVPTKMPAYTQVIKGTPYAWWSSDDIWYMPESRRVNSPYGEPFIEAAWPWVMIIVNLTAFELAHYRTGNMPEGYVTLPKDWLSTPDQMEALEVAFNERMTRNPTTERNRIRLFPDGAKWFQTKRGEWPETLYNRARGNILDEIGIPPAEAGDIPGEGLGGKGFKEGATTELNRNTINPNRLTVLAPFNHILRLDGVQDATMSLEPPMGEIDPGRLRETVYEGMAHGTYSLNDGRSLLNMAPIGDPNDPKNVANLHMIVAGAAMYVIEEMEIEKGMAVPSFGGDKAGGEPAGPETAAGEPEHTPQDVETVEKIMRTVLETGKFSSKFYSIAKAGNWDEDKHPRADDGKFGHGGGGAEKPEAENKQSEATRDLGDLKPKAILRQAKKESQEHTKGLSFTEKRELNDYTGNSNKLNSNLRKDSPDITDKIRSQNLDKILDKSRFGSKAITYRGLSTDPGFEVGQTFLDKAYVSTTYEHERAKGFAKLGAEQTGSVMRIRIKPETKAVSLAAVSAYPDETEVLLPRNTKFRIVGKTTIPAEGKRRAYTQYDVEVDNE